MFNPLCLSRPKPANLPRRPNFFNPCFCRRSGRRVRWRQWAPMGQGMPWGITPRWPRGTGLHAWSGEGDGQAGSFTEEVSECLRVFHYIFSTGLCCLLWVQLPREEGLHPDPDNNLCGFLTLQNSDERTEGFGIRNACLGPKHHYHFGRFSHSFRLVQFLVCCCELPGRFFS